MNRPNQAIAYLIAAMTAAACITAASLGPSRSARPVVRLLDPPVKVAGPTARDLRLQAMHELMTPVKTVLPPAAVPVAKVEPAATIEVEVAAVEGLESTEEAKLSYESSCGLDHATGKVYPLPVETAEESTSADSTEQSAESRDADPRQSQFARPAWSATVRQAARPTFVIYRRSSLVLKTENQLRDERSAERMRTLVRSTVDQMSLGSWQAVAQAWVDRLNLPWEQLTATEASKEQTAVLEAPPERESRAYRSVLRNRTLQ